jgi:hypothetical protein
MSIWSSGIKYTKNLEENKKLLGSRPSNVMFMDYMYVNRRKNDKFNKSLQEKKVENLL